MRQQNVSKIHYAAPDYRIENLNYDDSELTNKIFFSTILALRKIKNLITFYRRAKPNA